MNLKCEGDLGWTGKVDTNENINGENVKLKDRFGKFSSEKSGMDKSFERLNARWPDAETSLQNDSMSINDFVVGLEDQGKLGPYATGQSTSTKTGKEQYKAAVKEVFAGVCKDYMNVN